MKAYITAMNQGKKQSSTFSVEEDLSGRNREMRLISVFPQATYQTIHGFGGAFTDAAGYVYSLMSEEDRREVIRAYFGRDGLRYTWGRTSIDSCDFSTEMYCAGNDPEDTGLEHMDYRRGEKYVLPLLKDAEAEAGAPIRMMLSPWSPPAWMKTNQSRLHGGSLREECAPLWAEYICVYITHCIETGMDVRLLSMQNEPHAVQTWDSCIVRNTEERDFIRQYLAPALKRHGLDQRVSLLIWDHNKEYIVDRAAAVICDEEMAENVGGIAFHWYSGDHFENVRMAHEKYPEKRLVFSEGCVEHSVFGTDAELLGALHYAHEYIGDINAGADTLIDWNLILDEKGGPNHVGNFCDAPIMYDTVQHVLHKRLSLDYIRHFSAHIRPGAVRIGVSRFSEELEATAARNPDGSLALVVLNHAGEDQSFFIRCDGHFYPLTIPAFGIATCVF